MAVKIETHDVAFLKDGEIVEHTVEVYGVDRLRAELEARRQGLAGTRGRQARSGAEMHDLGDMLNRRALDLWATCVRLGIYDGDALTWRTRDYVGSEEHKDVEAEVGPTPPVPSNGTD